MFIAFAYDIFNCVPRILKLPLCYDNAADVHKVFLACCILHNMLLLVDQPFEDGQPNASEILGNIVSRRQCSAVPGAGIEITSDLDVSGVGMAGAPPVWLFQDGSTEPTHWTLRDKLARHVEIVRSSRRS